MLCLRVVLAAWLLLATAALLASPTFLFLLLLFRLFIVGFLVFHIPSLLAVYAVSCRGAIPSMTETG